MTRANVVMLYRRAARAHDASVARAELGQGHSSNAVPAIRAFALDHAPAEVIGSVVRSAQIPPNEFGRLFLAGSLLASFVLHGFVLLAVQQEPKPLASIGLPVISVEIVLGATTPAGQATSPVQQEAVDTVDTATPEPQPAEVETARIEPEAVRRSESEVAAVETAPDPQAKPIEALEQSSVEPITVVAREPPRPLQQMDRKPQPETGGVARQPRDAVRTRRPDNVDGTSRSASISNPASGVGRGRSDADTNYRGLVAAHLARHKRGDLRDQGKATVNVAIDGRGNVTSVRVVRGTGLAGLDQEAQAMVRRASPFPPPPSGRPESLMVPLSFTTR